ncbi:MAG TPA: alpha/beta hydrolase, partial [Planctomycetaceae bacterium]|nr:alpha/beta hydrolase [Planctomycetaceae bacterium]
MYTSIARPLLAFILCTPLTLLGAESPPDWWRYLPRADRNNVWYAQNADSPTVYVFIHGIFSSSRSCWLYESPDRDPGKSAYWPQLLVTDPVLERPSIYLSGFYTKLESGRYDMAQAAQEIVDALRTDRVLNGKRQVILVGHSTGGIMARYLLAHHSELFLDKDVGLLLMASPSMGSKLASAGHLPARFMDQQLGQQLEWNSPFLKQLDRDFQSLLHEKRSLHIEGREVLENKFVVDAPLLSRMVVVEEASGSRYFGPARMIGGSDHHSVVKPQNIDDPIHKVL